MKQIVIASDHAGFELKNELIEYIKNELGYEVEDLGAHEHSPDDDYPDFVGPAAERVSDDPEHTRGIVLGGSGQGEAMLANRYKGVRAAVYYGGPEDIITLSRVHNDANALSLGARFIDSETAKKVVQLWLTTEHPKNSRYDDRIAEAEKMTS